MARITLKGNPFETVGSLPSVGSDAPSFSLTKTDLSDVKSSDFAGKTILLNIFPSIDTPVCANSVRRFNMEASSFSETIVLCISADLPFSHERFCEVENLNDVIPLSVFRFPDFGMNYGVTIKNGPLAGLLSRAIVIIDKTGKIAYTEQVPEIAKEPNYEKALKALSSLTS